jgi:hypothetical protein
MIGSLTLLGAVVYGVSTLRKPTVSPTLAFVGREESNGDSYAVFEFAPVKSSPPSGRWYIWRYALTVQYVYYLKDGSMRMCSFEDSGGPSPAGVTELKAPIPPDTVRIVVLSAYSSLFRYWDNIRLPFPPPTETWTFSAPKEPLFIGSPSENYRPK